MEAKIINLNRIESPETIKEVVSKIVNSVNVNHVYLTIKENKSPINYYFTIIIEEMAKRFKERIKGVLDDCVKMYPDCYLRFFTLHNIQNETNNGNTFFLNHCTEDRLIYCYTIYNSNWLFKKIDFSLLIKTANENYIKRREKILAFKKGADLFLKEQDYGQAAFMLHQTIEQSFITAEYFLMGTNFTGHLISDHQTFMGNVNTTFGNIFPRKTKKQTKLLNKLNQAYVKPRYALNYNINKKQVEKISKKAEVLIKLLDTHFEAELKTCKKNIELYHSITVIPEAKPDIKEETASGEQSLLQKVKELSEDGFELLKPIGGVRKGYYLKYAYVYDYFNLFRTLKSTINVCILALEGRIDMTLDIRNKESDVISVLEFAKNLIPMEEATYLDEMRKLMAEVKKNNDKV
ncbi:HEPN domain-containing protein [Aureibaculum sp. 2210JD6-5]|uniref:HEPN domain-containing protein n=1 Tax=Aureibaculum sp. 2210JD6-5 TaxID=3103957 RepID=UPI002AAD9541|nr:HEPN domain-containing protein [Aureibaculum sp. 2210JD6-5]MDY7396333.1 HEPN domain-containing protein [Aureibaculum sp. 2210JD6-5]